MLSTNNQNKAEENVFSMFKIADSLFSEVYDSIHNAKLPYVVLLKKTSLEW